MYDAFGKQVNNQISADADVVCVCGTTSAALL